MVSRTPMSSSTLDDLGNGCGRALDNLPDDGNWVGRGVFDP
jgi:hypothetical protein